MEKIFKLITLLMISAVSVSCSQRAKHATAAQKSDGLEKTVVFSDDSVVSVCWWNTGEGGTAPDIESVCTFKTESGKVVEDKRPLLNIANNGKEYSHHEVERVVTYEGEYNQKVYLFFLRAKVGSNEYSHDIVALIIDGDKLCPVDLFNITKSNLSNICLNL